MTVPTYTQDDHKKAFVAFRDTGNLSSVSRAYEISQPTLNKWRADKFICPFGCPYHGWDSLIQEGRRVSDAKTDLISQSNFDPVATGNMIESIVGEKPLLAEVSPTVQVTLTERQRLAHWYYVYCHVFHQISGIALDHLTLHDSLSGELRIQAQTRYERGLRLNNAADAIRVLALAQDQIRNLEASINGIGLGNLRALPTAPADPLLGLGPNELRKLITHMEKRSDISGIAVRSEDAEVVE